MSTRTAQTALTSPNRPAAKGVARMQGLEPRTLLSAVNMTAYEQYMLELINRARSNPSAEASRQGISLNEGLATNTISTSAKQPLAGNLYLNDATRTHANWLRSNSLFQHAGQGGSTVQQRASVAGYAYSGDYGFSENLGLVLGSSLGDMTERVETLFKNLFIDGNVAGRGHRTNMMDPVHKEMGSGIAIGDYTYNNAMWTSILSAQTFARTEGNPFLTGVVFNDTVRADGFYTPGEAMTTVTITATSTDGQTYTTTSAVAGGYALQVPAGMYTLKATWSNKVVTYSNVVVGAQNVKRDFKQADFATASTPNPNDPVPTINATLSSNGLLWVKGTEASEVIEVSISGNVVTVQIGDENASFTASAVLNLLIEARGGDDFINVGEAMVGCTVIGGEGNDTIIGTRNADTLYGSDGDDSISAGGGNDLIYGGAGNDQINGGSAKNTIYGEDGDDRLRGSNGVDKIYGGAGSDRLYGFGGDDFLDGGGGTDRLYGGDGNDTLNGGSSNDQLYGDAGNDYLIGFKGRDNFRGGLGTDTVHDWEIGELLAEIEIK